MIRGIAAALFVAAVLLSSAMPIVSGSRYAFRDVNHFYLPLYDYIGQRNRSDWLPLWNPLDHLGMPLIGETSTAVLYPIRLAVFQLPVLGETAINLYLVFHLMLAAATSAWLAKRIGCKRLGIIAAAILYPLSGSVFSLVTNPPFLVGAAWLPLVLAACLGEKPTKKRSGWLWRRTVVAGIGLAMMVLGGDPQTALHAVLVITVVTTARWCWAWRDRYSTRAAKHQAAKQVFAIVLGAGGLALAIAAVQVTASYDWSRQSDRVLDADLRTDLYDFSLGPWHSLELISARPFGHPFPVNRWIAKLLPTEGRMWTPSIYAGLVVGFALLSRLLKPKTYFSEPWFGIALVALTLCFGHFGIVWGLQQIPGVLGGHDSAIGGPFWLLCNALPGYDSFRYPIKWLPVFSIASTMVTAHWLETKPATHERRLAVALTAVCAVAIAATHVLVWVHPSDRTMTGDWLPVDEYWGPLDVIGGLSLSRSSWLLSLLTLGVLWKLRSLSLHRGDAAGKRLLVAWLLLIGADAGLNAYHLIPTVDVARERYLSHQASPPEIATKRTLRTQAGMWPDRWRESQSPHRALEVAASERMAWFGRWHLAEQRAVFNSMVSIRSARYANFWRWVDRHLDADQPASRTQFWDAAGRWLAIDSVSHVDETMTTAADGLAFVHVDRRIVESVPPVRVTYRWHPIAPLAAILEELAQSGNVPLPHVPITPPRDWAIDDQNEDGSDIKGDASWQGARPSWESVDERTFWIQCDRPCVVERSVLQDGNWSAELWSENRRVEYLAAVVPSSQLNQAVWIPEAGRWRVTFVYRPRWLWPTLAISGAGWLACGLLLVASWYAPLQNLRRRQHVR